MIKQPYADGLERRPAYFTYDPKHGGAYYFAPSERAPQPYLVQREVTAILDIAADGTLAGVELVFGELPPPPMPHTDDRTAGSLSNTDSYPNTNIADTDASG